MDDDPTIETYEAADVVWEVCLWRHTVSEVRVARSPDGALRKILLDFDGRPRWSDDLAPMFLRFGSRRAGLEHLKQDIQEQIRYHTARARRKTVALADVEKELENEP